MIPSDISIFIAAAAAILSLIGFLDRKYGASAKFQRETLVSIARLEERKTDPIVLQRLQALETVTKPFMRVLEDHMIELLKQPIHLKMDELLERFKHHRDEMTLFELEELKCEVFNALQQNITDKAKAQEGRTVGYVVYLGLLESRIMAKMAATEMTRVNDLAELEKARGANECTTKAKIT